MVMGWDGYVCLMLAGLTAWLAGEGARAVADTTYAGYVEEHMVAEGEVGGIAGEDVLRAESIADLLENDTFTVISPGTQYMSRGAAYYELSSGKRVYMRELQLPSGEIVAAHINGENVQRQGESFVDEISILPVGCVVYEDMTQDQAFVESMQYFSHPLSRMDFYVDMVGDGTTMGQEQYSEWPATVAFLITGVIMFPLLHALGARIGIWGYYFPHKEKENRKTG